MNSNLNKTECHREDFLLIDRSLNGDRVALEDLIEKYQDYLFTLCLKMLGHYEDAEDAAQEILVKIITNLSTFNRNSSFKTWIFRIAKNHIYNMINAIQKNKMNFENYSKSIKNSPDISLETTEVEYSMLLEETRCHCLLGMLMCLNESQRFSFILTEMFGLNSIQGAEIMDITPTAYRKMISRARIKLGNFLKENCGLIDPGNSCKCYNKTKGLINLGLINPDDLVLNEKSLSYLKEITRVKVKKFSKWYDRSCYEFFAENFLHKSPDYRNYFKNILSSSELKNIMKFN